MKLSQLVMIACAIQSASAASISTDVVQGGEYGQESRIDKQKSIEIRKSKDKKQSQGRERRSDDEVARASGTETEITSEVDATSVLLPALAQLENEWILKRPAPRQKGSVFSFCQLLTGPVTIPSSVALHWNDKSFTGPAKGCYYCTVGYFGYLHYVVGNT